MRKGLVIMLLPLLLLLGGCGAAAENPAKQGALCVQDSMGHCESFAQCPERVVALSESYGDVWLKAGGTLVGISDEGNNYNIDGYEELAKVGTVKEPNLEIILSLEPDYILLSSDIDGHVQLRDTLDSLRIPYSYFKEEKFEDYLAMLEQFTKLTGRQDLLEENGYAVQNNINGLLSASENAEGKRVLLLRAFSSGCKAKDSDNQTGAILKDFGFENVMDSYEGLHPEELSTEEILALNPDYIFVTVMGTDAEAAMDYFETNVCQGEIWERLEAVKNNRFYVLPQELFHFKPNARWDEAYAYIAAILG